MALFPSLDFISQNQLAKEGSQSVSPVIILAFNQCSTYIVDRQ